MKRSKLKKNVTVEKCMSNTKRERHIIEDNSNNINIKAPAILLKCFYCFIVVIKHVSIYQMNLYNLFKKKQKKQFK